MAKFHAPAARRLVHAEATIKRQADHIHELETTVFKLRAKLATYGAKLDDTNTTSRSLNSQNRRRSSCDSSVAADSAAAIATETPSYLKPTNSFRAKTRLADVPESPTDDYCCHTRVTVNGHQYMYVDGALVGDALAAWSKNDFNLPPSFARDTNASIRRRETRKPVESRYNSWGMDMDGLYPSDTEVTDPKASSRKPKGWDTLPSGWSGEESNSSSSCSSQLSSTETTTTTATTPTEPEQDVEEAMNPLELLAAQTRLSEKRQSRRWSDDEPPLHPATFVYLPSKFIFRQLQRAHRLAQEAFFHALRKDWPDVQQDYFPGGPQEIPFGRTDMEQCWNRLEHGINKTRENLRSRSTSGIFCALNDMANLRNTLCHYHRQVRQRAPSLDCALQSAQRLAVELLDEGCARKIRAIRDAVWERAVAELRDIEEKEALVALPGCRVRWKVHQEQLFRSVTSCDSPPDSLARAAEQWQKERSMSR